jgi:hypothetical protein
MKNAHREKEKPDRVKRSGFFARGQLGKTGLAKLDLLMSSTAL